MKKIRRALNCKATEEQGEPVPERMKRGRRASVTAAVRWRWHHKTQLDGDKPVLH